MTKWLNNFFSDEYVNRNAIVNNYLLVLMYRFAFPFSVLLNKINITPNQITTQSIVFSLLAFLSLVFDKGWVLFVVFWSISSLLDFCDGTVARMSGKINKTAFNYDHISDLLKINLVILGAGIHYNSYVTWIISFLASFFFMYYTVLNHELAAHDNTNKKVKRSLGNDEDDFKPKSRLRNRYHVIAWFVKSEFRVKFYINIHSAFSSINGHTLLIFLLIPFGEKYVIGSFMYLIILSLFGSKSRVFSLMSTPK